MDPNATLEELRKLSTHIIAELESDTPEDLTEEAEDFATLLQSLDDWICGGGSLPSVWQRKT